MATIPVWQIGKHLVSITVTPQTVSAAGVLSDGTAKALAAVASSCQINLTPNHANINATKNPRANHVIVEDDWSVVIGILKVNDTSDPDPLATMISTNDYFKIVFAIGTATGSVETYTLYGTRGVYNGGYQGKAEQMGSLEFLAVDTGSGSFFVRQVA